LRLAVNTLAIGFDYHRKMVIRSSGFTRRSSWPGSRSGGFATRTAVSAWPGKDGQEVGEEAVEVVIDAVNGKSDAVVREESADSAL